MKKGLSNLTNVIEHMENCVYVSPNLLFHVESLNTPNEIWKKLESLFGAQDSLRGHMLDNELIILNPGNFNTTKDFFTKMKSLRQQCGIDKKDEQLILSILSKLSFEYSVFVSTFYATKDALGSQFKMQYLDDFATSLIWEKDKLIQMGTLKSSKSHDLAANLGTN